MGLRRFYKRFSASFATAWAREAGLEVSEKLIVEVDADDAIEKIREFRNMVTITLTKVKELIDVVEEKEFGAVLFIEGEVDFEDADTEDLPLPDLNKPKKGDLN